MVDVQENILVVLPTLGERIDSFRLTLRSIELQRDQVGVRLIVVIPAYAIEARKLAESFGAELVDDPGHGMSAAINAGLAQRKNEVFYSWMGDDDLFLPEGLATLRGLFEKNQSAVVGYGGCVYINELGFQIGVSRAGKLAKWILPWGPDLIPHPGSMIRLDALFSVGLYDTSLKYAMDLDVFLKLKQIGKFESTRNAVSSFRWHSNSLTVSGRKASSAESESVKRRYLGPFLASISFLWEAPIRIAASIAAQRVNARAKTLLR